ncbi:hypothetical protein [Chryseobacterium sp. PvR013]|uniref:hypothetical protein n=1 Tax=Chryseobacterium sp. PvR013 TaxID=2806595 RepID=UPI001AE9D75E|nr:hypothetical protein [Chryseobacterium sp. PvR013]
MKSRNFLMYKHENLLLEAEWLVFGSIVLFQTQINSLKRRTPMKERLSRSSCCTGCGETLKCEQLSG